MFPISPDLICSVLGGAAGFFFKLISIKQQNDKEKFDRMLGVIKAQDDSMDKASQRDSSSAGQITRRILIVSILFGVVLAPFLMTLLGFPIIVQLDLPVKEHLMGLWSTNGKTVFYELNGYLLIPELRQSLLILIFYYYGQATAKK